MYNEYLDYVWKTEKQHLEFEISKLEGQLRNCRARLGLLKREMIVRISLVVVPGTVFYFIPGLPINSGFRILNNLLTAARDTVGLVTQTFYVVLLPFLIYYMMKSIMQYRMNIKEKGAYEELTVLDPCNREPPEPEETYAAEETKLVRILSIYYDYRNQLDRMQEKMITDELTFTVDELKKELEKLVYYEEITPINSHARYINKKAKFYAVIAGIVIWLLVFRGLFWPIIKGLAGMVR